MKDAWIWIDRPKDRLPPSLNRGQVGRATTLALSPDAALGDLTAQRAIPTL
jgi:hypothetical protein